MPRNRVGATATDADGTTGRQAPALPPKTEGDNGIR